MTEMNRNAIHSLPSAVAVLGANTSAALALVFALFAVPSAACFAQTQDHQSPKMPPATHHARTLSWDEALRIAAEKNPALQAARQSLQASESRRKSAAWSFGPRLSADASWGREEQGGRGADDAYSATLGISQPLFELSTFGRLGEANASRKEREAALTNVKAELLRDLKTSFATIVFSQSRRALAQSIVARRKRNLDLVELRFEGGRENRGAVLLSQANFEEARLELLQAENATQTQQTRIKALLDLDGSDPIVLSDEPQTNPPPTQVDFQAMVREAPELRQSLAAEERSRAAVTTAKGSLAPSAALSANLGKFGDRFFPQTDGWSVGVRVSLPFGDIPAYHSLQAARAESEAAMRTRRSIENSIRVRLEETYNAYVEADTRVRTSQLALKATTMRAEIARQRYETGLVSFDEWDRIESDLITREIAALQATRDRVTAEAAWDFILGRGDPL